MHPQIEALLERPTSHKVVGVTLINLLIFGGFWFLLYSPALDTYSELEKEVEKLESKKATELRVSRNLPKFKAEVKDLNEKLQILLQELPDKKEIPDLLNSISNLAVSSGLEVALVKTREEQLQDFYAEVPMELSVVGPYHQIASFFDEVGRLSRIVNLSRLALWEPKSVEDRFVIRADCLATTFRYLDDSERATMQKKKEGARRKRGRG